MKRPLMDTSRDNSCRGRSTAAGQVREAHPRHLYITTRQDESRIEAAPAGLVEVPARILTPPALHDGIVPADRLRPTPIIRHPRALSRVESWVIAPNHDFVTRAACGFVAHPTGLHPQAATTTIVARKAIAGSGGSLVVSKGGARGACRKPAPSTLGQVTHLLCRCQLRRPDLDRGALDAGRRGVDALHAGATPGLR